MRFITVLCAAAALCCVVAGSASALAFDDQSYNWPVGTVGVPYAKQLGTRGDCPPFKYTIDSGFMAPGTSLSIDGLASGTPTAAGTFSFWVRLRDCLNQSAERLFTMVINPASGPPAVQPLQVTTSALRTGVVGQGYSLTLGASGGEGSQSWTASGLPAGLALNGSTISGTPTAAGDFSVSVTVSSGGSSVSKQLPLKVIVPLDLDSDVPRAAEVGRPLTVALTASGGSPGYTWTLSGVPAGLTFDSAKGVLTGSPEKPGRYTVHVVLTDAGGNTTASDVAFTVLPKLALVTRSIKAARAGRAYRAQLSASGGVPALQWSSAVPRGLRLDARTGKLSGTPRAVGTYRLRVLVRDSLGASATRLLVLHVNR
jgi:hypothetical protein